MSARRLPWWKPRRSRAVQRVALLVVLVCLGVAAWALHRAWVRLLEYPERPGPGSSELVEIEIPKGASFPQVLALLVEHGVVPEADAIYFKLYVLHEGAARKTSAGRHRFRGDMTPAEILDELARKQKTEELAATVPEGKNILEVAAILSEAGLGDAAALEVAMRDPALLAELEIPGPTAEGYLFPDTYKFRADATPPQVITKMVKRHREVFAELRRRYRTELRHLEDQLEWTDHQIVVLASIVEKETAAKHERPLIAGVFLNRLRFPSFSPKRLETDPTIVYGCIVPLEKSAACQQFEGRIRKIHLRDPDNPYSTYTHEGLPPGPIANPGREALEAVLAPKSSRFLYFVSRNDGTHQFSKTVAEHDAAVELYQRKGAVGDGSAAGAEER